MDAAGRVAAVADDPSGRLALASEFYATAPAACHSYGRGQLAFMGWEVSRGVLNPLAADQPGSQWWRTVNAGLLTDQIEAVSPPDSGPGGLGVQRWRAFLQEPTPLNWYAAHNTSVVNGYLEAAELATREAMSEQWFINLVLIRVLFAHASIADDRAAGTLFAELGAVLSQPTGRAISDAVHLNDFYPATYPIHPCHAWWAELAPSAWFERFVDNRFVLPHSGALFRSASATLSLDDLALLAINDVPAYPWPLIQGGASPPPPKRTWFGRLLHHHAEAKPPADPHPHPPATPDYEPKAAAATLLGETGDRPWPTPDRPWLAFQRWEHILFLHWPVPVDVVRSQVPDGLEIDTFDGSAWVAVVPLKMADVHLRHLPQGGPISNFPELNLRTYVRYKGQPGVWFFSLDAPSRFDVWIGRHVFHLRYDLARSKLATDSATEHHLSFRSARDTGWEGAPEGAPAAVFEATYHPKGTGAPPVPGTLEYFLCERYAMFTRDATGNYLMGEIHHRPWQIFSADVTLTENTVAAAAGISLSGPPTSALYSPVMENVVWPMVRV